MTRSHSPTRPVRLIAFAFAVVAGFATRPAHGAWTYFYVTNSNGTKIAEVAEQIFNTGTNLGYDYEFQVANITPNRAPIYGFELYVGNQAGLARQALFPLGPVPGYRGYSLYFGNIPNASSPFLTGEGQTYTPISWGFSEFLSANGYRLTWGTPRLPLPYHYFTEFDLFSPNPPVPGGGAVDPFAGPGGLGIDLDGTGTFTGTDFPGTTVPISPSQDTSMPFPDFVSYASVPEPGSFLMLACGAALVGGVEWRRRSNRRAVATT